VTGLKRLLRRVPSPEHLLPAPRLLATVAALAALAATPAASAELVTFEVEVPYCTPPGAAVHLRSNRLEADSFRHDPLERVGPTRYRGTFDVVTPTDRVEYKYAHGLCDAAACQGIEKALTFDGQGGEIEPRRLAEGADRVEDLVFVWRDAVRVFDEDGQAVAIRRPSELVAFCGPYLSVSDVDGGLTLSHDAYDAGELILDYGPTADYGERMLAAGSHRNRFPLLHVEPGQTVHYRITEDGIPGVDRTFVAPPTAGETLRVGFVGDLQYTGEELRQEAITLFGRLRDLAPHVVLSAGDLVSSGEGAQGWIVPEQGRWNVFFGVAADLLGAAPFLTAMGNHEEDAPYFWDVFDFPQPDAPLLDHFWFKVGHAHVTVLYTGTTGDYSVAGMLDSQTAWLDGVLESAAADPTVRWKIVVLHRGPYHQGANHPDDGRPFFEGLGGRPGWGGPIGRHGVDLVLTGHNHLFSWAFVDGVHFVTSCAGAPHHAVRQPLEPFSRWAEETCSANLFELTARTASLTAVRPDGSVIEQARFALCHEDADCDELEAPCPADTEWRCGAERTCEHRCVEVPVDAGIEDAGDAASDPSGDADDARDTAPDAEAPEDAGDPADASEPDDAGGGTTDTAAVTDAAVDGASTDGPAPDTSDAMDAGPLEAGTDAKRPVRPDLGVRDTGPRVWPRRDIGPPVGRPLPAPSGGDSCACRAGEGGRGSAWTVPWRRR